ncbi:uncharacterized protein LOC136035222 [Artemia franciscana]|uniref:uncharacterized protein LOC136035222 n=1 Tax=Artemia franciscana TaxID=6661 RepID=UPI0032DB9DE9
MRLKLHLLNSNVMSILLFASECWKLNTQLEKRVLAFENMCLRRILNIPWQEKVTNIEARRRTGQPLVTDLLKRSRWTYLGHVLRMPEDRLPNTVYDWRPEGRRKRGRPRHTLRRQYDRDLRNAELSLQPQWEDVTAAAQLRDVWRGFANNQGMMAAQGQPQLIRTAGNVQQQRYMQMDQERQQNLLRIQQLQRELNETQQREQLFKAQQASIANPRSDKAIQINS